jgi:hypothetical protein
MIDARNFVNSLDAARNILIAENAVFKGEYDIHDIIYKSKDLSVGIEKTFLRLRIVPLNIWNEKSYIVSIKHTDVKEVGKESIIPVKVQFDTEQEARDFVEKNYSDQFEYDFEFSRKGWQYDLGEDQVDLEDIQGHYSIEFKSKTEEGLKLLLTKFDAKDIIVGPSVMAVKNILGLNK